MIAFCSFVPRSTPDVRAETLKNVAFFNILNGLQQLLGFPRCLVIRTGRAVIERPLLRRPHYLHNLISFKVIKRKRKKSL